MDIGIMIQLAMLGGSVIAVGIMAFISYRKGRDDEKAVQLELDLKYANKVEEVRNRPKPSPSAIRNRLRDGKF